MKGNTTVTVVQRGGHQDQLLEYLVVQATNTTIPHLHEYLSEDEVKGLIGLGIKVTIKPEK